MKGCLRKGISTYVGDKSLIEESQGFFGHNSDHQNFEWELESSMKSRSNRTCGMQPRPPQEHITRGVRLNDMELICEEHRANSKPLKADSVALVGTRVSFRTFKTALRWTSEYSNNAKMEI